MVGLRYYWVSRLGKIRNIFLRHGVSIDVENALLVLYCTQSLACVTCFSQQSQDVRMNHFFCVYIHSCATDLFQFQCQLFTHAVLFANTFFVSQIARRVFRHCF